MNTGSGCEYSIRAARLRSPMGLRIALASLGLAISAPVALASDPFLRENTTVRVVKDVGPSVVNITTERIVASRNAFPRGGNPFFDSFFRDFFEPRIPETVQNLGSGVLIDAERHILTNEHVVGRASRIRVSLADGTEFDATLIGADPNNDIAVLRVDTDKRLPWLKPGRSNDLMVGESVIAIGNPFGLSNTVTTGVISALNRSVRTDNFVYHGFLQTDASINPGNSGGPLVNAEGELIAINTAVYGGAQGIGFAIPIDTAKRVVDELIEHGEVTPVWLGLDLQDLDPRLAAAMDLPPRPARRTRQQGARRQSRAARQPATRRRGDPTRRPTDRSDALVLRDVGDQRCGAGSSDRVLACGATPDDSSRTRRAASAPARPIRQRNARDGTAAAKGRRLHGRLHPRGQRIRENRNCARRPRARDQRNDLGRR